MDKILTLIIPSYNMEAYLPRCLGSLVVSPELMGRLEVLVVNDGSKDRTSEIAHEFENKYPQTFKVIDKANGHYGSCVNAGVAVATGKYIKILDADDWFDENGLAGFLHYLTDMKSEVDLVISDNDVVDEFGTVLEHRTFEKFNCSEYFSLKRFLACKKYLSMHAYTYRTDMVRSLDYKQLEGVAYTDSEWIWVPLARVEKVSYYPAVVYKYLLGREGQTMDPKVLEQNRWVKVRIFFHAMEQIQKINKFASDVAKKRVYEIANGYVDAIYRDIVFKKAELSNPEFETFDDNLERTYPDLYIQARELIYSKRLPVHYVKIWRGKNILKKPLIYMCSCYSWIVKLLPGKK